MDRETMTDPGLAQFEAWLRDELREAGCEIRTLSPEGMAGVTVRRLAEQGWTVIPPSVGGGASCPVASPLNGETTAGMPDPEKE